MRVDFLLTGAGQLATCEPALGEGPLGLVERGAVAAAQGTVVYAGPERGLPDLEVAAGATRLDAGGRAVLPGFVDAHTHLVFAGDRADEFAARLRGVGYEEALAALVSRTVRLMPPPGGCWRPPGTAPPRWRPSPGTASPSTTSAAPWRCSPRWPRASRSRWSRPSSAPT